MTTSVHLMLAFEAMQRTIIALQSLLLLTMITRCMADAVCTTYGLSYPPPTQEEAIFLYFLLKDDSDTLIQ